MRGGPSLLFSSPILKNKTKKSNTVPKKVYVSLVPAGTSRCFIEIGGQEVLCAAMQAEPLQRLARKEGKTAQATDAEAPQVHFI